MFLLGLCFLFNRICFIVICMFRWIFFASAVSAFFQLLNLLILINVLLQGTEDWRSSEADYFQAESELVTTEGGGALVVVINIKLNTKMGSLFKCKINFASFVCIFFKFWYLKLSDDQPLAMDLKNLADLAKIPGSGVIFKKMRIHMAFMLHAIGIQQKLTIVLSQISSK